MRHLDCIFPGDAAAGALATEVVARRRIAQPRHEVLDCQLKLQICWKFRVGV